jgi:hypothetical protein
MLGQFGFLARVFGVFEAQVTIRIE